MSQRREQRWERWKGCLKKRRHETEEDAVRAAREFREDRGEEVKHYKCLFCDGWHIGHPSRKYGEECST